MAFLFQTVLGFEKEGTVFFYTNLTHQRGTWPNAHFFGLQKVFFGHDTESKPFAPWRQQLKGSGIFPSGWAAHPSLPFPSRPAPPAHSPSLLKPWRSGSFPLCLAHCRPRSGCLRHPIPPSLPPPLPRPFPLNLVPPLVPSHRLLIDKSVPCLAS